MRLKSLKLAGFKSFANPTTFSFRHGITAIVGPNGCGKSNVIDAIRWVLGESSAKQLRGGSMSDVIFAGTQDKGAKSLASVELTFEHTQDEHTGIRHELNLYHELSVRRQVNKDGKSDYFINGTRCRRRDVVDVFLGTGLGPRSYSVIQQGMIGRIVDSSPLQLREFIEEAAGVSRYQARREQTQKKLNRALENLERLNDIKTELTRQQKVLAKQAQSALNYQQLQSQLALIRQQLTIIGLLKAKKEQMQYKVAQAENASLVNQLQATQTRLKSKLEALNERLAQAQWLKDDARERLHEKDMAHQQLENQLNNCKSTIDQLNAQLDANRQAHAQAMQEIETLNIALGEHTETLKVLQEQQRSQQRQKQALQQRLEPLQNKCKDINERQTILLEDKRALEQRQALNNQAQTQSQRAYDKWQHNHQLWQQQIAQLETQNNSNLSSAEYGEYAQSADEHNASPNHSKLNLSILSIKKRIKQLSEQVSRLTHQQDDITDQLEENEPKLTRINQSLNDKKSLLAKLQTKHASFMGEYDTLHAIVHPAKPKIIQSLNLSNNIQTKSNSSQVGQQTDTGELAKLSSLHDTITLTKKGEAYASELDKWLPLCLDSRFGMLTTQVKSEHTNSQESLLYTLLNSKPCATGKQGQKDKSKNNNQAINKHGSASNVTNKQANSIQPIDSVLFEVENYAGLDQQTQIDLPDYVVPVSSLIAKPELQLFQNSYLYLSALIKEPESINEDNSSQNPNHSDSDKNNHYKVGLTSDVNNILSRLPIGSQLLSSTGWLISYNGAVHISKLLGGNTNADQSSQFLSQRLAQKQRLIQLEDELTDIETQIEQYSQSIKQLSGEHDQLIVITQELNAQSKQMLHEQHECQQLLTQLKGKLQEQQHKLEHLNTQGEQLDHEKRELDNETTQLQDEKAQIDQLMQALLPKLEVINNQQQQLNKDRQDIEQQLQLHNEAWQRLQIDLNKAEHAKDYAEVQLTKLEATLKKQQVQNSELEKKLSAQESELPALTEQLKAANDASYEQRTSFEEHTATIITLSDELNKLQQQQNTIEQDLQNKQQLLTESTSQLAVANERIKESSERLQALYDIDNKANESDSNDDKLKHQPSPYTLLSEFVKQGTKMLYQYFTIDEALTNSLDDAELLSEKYIATLNAEQDTLDHKISKIGAVNLAATQELEQVNERLEPLSHQIDDITASMQTLKDAIDKIDAKTKTLFMATLEAVNRDLTALFTKVFGGGQATLTLMDDENLSKSEQWRAGLELMAQPKGKRNSRLAVLSGGEKTLTALSLIFAIFKQHPAPFCVLDEVDAPLDDANVTRFTGLINELASEVQFIFISHNKLSMQIAQELKGVTMPQAGISTLVSVSLEEAEKYIESTA